MRKNLPKNEIFLKITLIMSLVSAGGSHNWFGLGSINLDQYCWWYCDAASSSGLDAGKEGLGVGPPKLGLGVPDTPMWLAREWAESLSALPPLLLLADDSCDSVSENSLSSLSHEECCPNSCDWYCEASQLEGACPIKDEAWLNHGSAPAGAAISALCPSCSHC